MTSYRGNPSVGARVVSADGRELGTVGQIAGTCFKVDAPEQEPFWLGADTVANTSGAGVRLNLPQEALGRPAVDDLPHHGFHWHSTTPA